MDSSKKTIVVATLLCVICSVLVSGAYVSQKPMQDRNAVLDTKKFILSSANLLEAGADIEATYDSKIEEKVLDIESGRILEIAAEAFNEAKEPELRLTNDPAGIGKARKKDKVYLIKNSSGGYDGVILRVKGQGLWNLMWAFLALKTDGKTVIGLKYYSQGETPGLGAEVENPRWYNQWIGKSLFDSEMKPSVSIVKIRSPENTEAYKQEVDALSGATITSQGVQKSLLYWLSDAGYGKFLQNFRQGAI